MRMRIRRKLVWASLKEVCEPKEKGGLGMLEVLKFNIALLRKWIWRLGTEKKGLWKEMLESKHGRWRSLRTKRNSWSDSLWWRDLKEI